MSNPVGVKHLMRTLGGERHVLDFSFAPNGSSDPDSTTIRGDRIKSIVHTATGKYTVTFYDAWVAKDMILSAHLSQAVPDGTNAVCGVFSASAKTLIVWTIDKTGAAADLTADADVRVAVRVSLRGRSLGK